MNNLTAPDFIGEAQTIFYTTIDQRHDKTGNTNHYVAGQLVSEISGLAICQYPNDNGFYLFSCNESWESITDTYHDTIENAKEQAEFEYENSIKTWIKK